MRVFNILGILSGELMEDYEKVVQNKGVIVVREEINFNSLIQ
jgi:hypothetical protein